MNWPYQFWKPWLLQNVPWSEAPVWCCIPDYRVPHGFTVWRSISASALLIFIFQFLEVALWWGCSPPFILPRSLCSQCAVFLLRVNTLAWLFPFHTDSSYCHPHLGTSVWHSSDVLWSPPRKLSSERQPLALLHQSGTLGVRFLVGGVAETGAHIALPGYCLLWPYTCWLFCSWRTGRKVWFLLTKIGSEWTDKTHEGLPESTKPHPLWAADRCFLCWQSTVEFVFTWKVALKEMAPTKEKLFLGIFGLVWFFEGRILEAYFLECVWMVMVQGLGWHVRRTWSPN